MLVAFLLLRSDLFITTISILMTFFSVGNDFLSEKMFIMVIFFHEVVAFYNKNFHVGDLSLRSDLFITV